MARRRCAAAAAAPCRYVHEMEKLRLSIATAADPLAGHLQIVDAAGMSVSKFWHSWKFFMAMSKVGSDNYPGAPPAATPTATPSTRAAERRPRAWAQSFWAAAASSVASRRARGC